MLPSACSLLVPADYLRGLALISTHLHPRITQLSLIYTIAGKLLNEWLSHIYCLNCESYEQSLLEILNENRVSIAVSTHAGICPIQCVFEYSTRFLSWMC